MENILLVTEGSQSHVSPGKVCVNQQSDRLITLHLIDIDQNEAKAFLTKVGGSNMFSSGWQSKTAWKNSSITCYIGNDPPSHPRTSHGQAASIVYCQLRLIINALLGFPVLQMMTKTEGLSTACGIVVVSCWLDLKQSGYIFIRVDASRGELLNWSIRGFPYRGEGE